MTTPVLMTMNMKGGVGKTVISISLSYAIAWLFDKNVLLVDLDPQASASYALLWPKRYFELLGEKRSLTAALMPELGPDDPFSVVKVATTSAIDATAHTVRLRSWYRILQGKRVDAGSMSIAPASIDLMRLALRRLPEEVEQMLSARWEAFIASAKRSYDCLVIDCHPAGSFFTKSAILSSNAVIIPATTDGYAEAGLGLMRRFIEDWERAGGASHFVVVFNDPHKAWDERIEATIRQDPRFKGRCLSAAFGYSKLFRNIAIRRQVVAEQGVAYRWNVSQRVNRVARELVDLLVKDGVIEQSWTKQ